MVKLPLEAKADVNVKDSIGTTALCSATEKGHVAVVKLLLKAKADVNMKNNYGETALYNAAEKGQRWSS